MKTGKLPVVLLLCLLLLSPLLASAAGSDAARATLTGILTQQQTAAGAASVQDWVDTTLTAQAGKTAEWYIIGLAQTAAPPDFSAYRTALSAALADSSGKGAVVRQRCALALLAAGDRSNPLLTQTLSETAGQQGIMSWVFALHLLNNGVSCADFTADSVVQTLLSLRLADGGWALTGTVSDVDVSAMTLQALAPHVTGNASVRTAVDEALSLLSEKQLATGDYASFGTENPESTAQVLIALASLGVDGTLDSRFQKNGCTLLDGLLRYRCADGRFAHTLGGKANAAATVQTFNALVALRQVQDGRGAFYMFPAVAQNTVPVSTTSTIPATTAPTGGSTNGGLSTVVSSTTTAQTTTATTASTTAEAKSHTVRQTTDSTIASPQNDADSSSNSPLKFWLIVGIVTCGGLGCLTLVLLKKRRRSNFAVIAVLTAGAILAVCLTDIQTADDYYNGSRAEKPDAIGTVTLTIRCDVLVGVADDPQLPADGVLLDTTTFALAPGETVYDILTEAARTYHLSVETNGAALPYVAGIQYLYEFDYGELSGWVYHVNGTAPSCGCDDYLLADGDAIVWHYTRSLGNDLPLVGGDTP